MREFHLKIGEQAQLKSNFFTAGHGLMYAGMPSESVYSLAFIFSHGYQAMAANMYIPTSQRELTYQGYRIVVQDVRPDHIRIQVNK